ncbi:MAG TPA: hypothetical protein ENF49_04615 [Candidatus Altiarchaeales archaeon]|nr:hypothetical protein [Candidatus Altiarchaeales archaeon]HEX55394.1 hypothetical protein [Candidatus Altiarchaeales archaeon]
MVKLIPIAGFGDLRIYAKRGCLYSFYSSPYPAHPNHSAVDITTGGKRYDEIFSPVSGVIVDIKKIDAPKFSKNLDPEFITIIRYNDEYSFKIIHMKPTLEIGDYVSAGDTIGELIRTEYFSRINDLGIHIEIRKNNDLYRALGGMPLKPIVSEIRGETELVGRISESNEKYSIVKIEKSGASEQIRGLTCKVNGRNAFLDFGYPYLEYGGVIGARNGNVLLNNIKIGISRENIIKFNKFHVYANDLRVESITSVLSLKDKAEIKITPSIFERGERVEFKIKEVI